MLIILIIQRIEAEKGDVCFKIRSLYMKKTILFKCLTQQAKSWIPSILALKNRCRKIMCLKKIDNINTLDNISSSHRTVYSEDIEDKSKFPVSTSLFDVCFSYLYLKSNDNNTVYQTLSELNYNSFDSATEKLFSGENQRKSGIKFGVHFLFVTWEKTKLIKMSNLEMVLEIWCVFFFPGSSIFIQ